MREIADTIEVERAHLFAIAYRMLGSASEAEDILQEAFLRFAQLEISVDSSRAWLTTVVVRLCVDHLKSARARRELYVGPWLPEPLVSNEDPLAPPDARTELAESLGIAFLVLLERLSPLERAAFLLREVFDEPFAEVAATLGTTEAAVRQLVTRARNHVQEGRPRFQAKPEKRQQLLIAFLEACGTFDANALGRILADDAVVRSDGGGRVHAAIHPVSGRERVIRFLFGILKKSPVVVIPELVYVNGQPGIVVRDENHFPQFVVALSVSNDVIHDVWILLNPDKLAHLDPSAAPGSPTAR